LKTFDFSLASADNATALASGRDLFLSEIHLNPDILE
jgi:hypothetical protein